MELAARAIDGLMDPSASADEKAACSRAHRFFETYASIRRNEPSAEHPEES